MDTDRLVEVQGAFRCAYRKRDESEVKRNYTTCIRPAMLYGSETWPTKIEDIRKIQRSEMRMLRWMTGVSLSERKSNEYVRSMLAIDDIAEVMQRNRLRWFGHVERRDELCWIKRIGTLQVDGDGVKGRPRKRWREVLKEDMREKGLCNEDAWDRSRWRMLWESHRQGYPQYTGKNNLIKINSCCCCCILLYYFKNICRNTYKQLIINNKKILELYFLYILPRAQSFNSSL